MIRQLLLMATAILILWTTTSQADVFHLANGSKLAGECLNPDESPRQSYQIRTEAGIELTFAADQVVDVVKQSVAEASYERAVHRMPNTLDGH